MCTFFLPHDYLIINQLQVCSHSIPSPNSCSYGIVLISSNDADLNRDTLLMEPTQITVNCLLQINSGRYLSIC